MRTGRDSERATWRDGRDGAGWRTSSWSTNNDRCCEASCERSGRVLLRDSLRPDGHILDFPDREWLSLLSSLP
ncbi:DUF397 domain-containing protein [Nocardiopsis sp. NPDC050513]|uniref:DUF397 domain-containing protein n=1 Tax=Nocardiopsis sp. NPDC050513 TaxID=3364338 RepID=UPI0037ABDD06